MDDDALPILIVIMLLAIAAIGFMCGQDSVRKEAIKANAAKWVVDEKTGGTRFIFIGTVDNQKN